MIMARIFTKKRLRLTVLLTYLAILYLVVGRSFTQTLPNQLDNLTVSQAYRIGDGIAQIPGSPGCEVYPGSLVCAYRRETSRSSRWWSRTRGGQANNIHALLRVMNRDFAQFPTLDADTIALHLRLGDGICARFDPPCRGKRTSVPNCWERDEDCWYDANSATKQYAYSKHWYASVIKEIKYLNGPHKILIFANIRHWTRTSDPRTNYDVDNAYINSSINFFHKAGFHTVLHATGTADNDFLLMSSARIFVRGGGGYSALVASVVEARDGRVIIPSML